MGSTSIFACDFAALRCSRKLEGYATEHLGTLRRLTGQWADPRSASILLVTVASRSPVASWKLAPPCL